MRARGALVLLAVGALLGAACALYAVPAAALAGWAICLVAAGTLAKATGEVRDVDGRPAAASFTAAAYLSALGIAAAALDLAGTDSVVTSVLPVVALLGVTVGSTSGLRVALQAGWRVAAAIRVQRSLLLAGSPLALFVVLQSAGSGPSWTGTALDVLRILTAVAVAWFAAFCIASRDAVSTA